MIIPGEVWTDPNQGQVVVISRVVARPGEIWIHYRTLEGQEFSCWETTFLARFTPTTHDPA